MTMKRATIKHPAANMSLFNTFGPAHIIDRLNPVAHAYIYSTMPHFTRNADGTNNPAYHQWRAGDQALIARGRWLDARVDDDFARDFAKRGWALYDTINGTLYKSCFGPTEERAMIRTSLSNHAARTLYRTETAQDLYVGVMFRVSGFAPHNHRGCLANSVESNLKHTTVGWPGIVPGEDADALSDWAGGVLTRRHEATLALCFLACLAENRALSTRAAFGAFPWLRQVFDLVGGSSIALNDALVPPKGRPRMFWECVQDARPPALGQPNYPWTASSIAQEWLKVGDAVHASIIKMLMVAKAYDSFCVSYPTGTFCVTQPEIHPILPDWLLYGSEAVSGGSLGNKASRPGTGPWVFDPGPSKPLAPLYDLTMATICESKIPVSD